MNANSNRNSLDANSNRLGHATVRQHSLHTLPSVVFLSVTNSEGTP